MFEKISDNIPLIQTIWNVLKPFLKPFLKQGFSYYNSFFLLCNAKIIDVNNINYQFRYVLQKGSQCL